MVKLVCSNSINFLAGEFERQILEARHQEESSLTSSLSTSSCRPGSEWKSASSRRGCNKICRCIESGVEECRERCRTTDADERLQEEGEEEEASIRGERQCRPNSEWMEKCNRCICTSAGNKACTKMNCDTEDGSWRTVCVIYCVGNGIRAFWSILMSNFIDNLDCVISLHFTISVLPLSPWWRHLIHAHRCLVWNLTCHLWVPTFQGKLTNIRSPFIGRQPAIRKDKYLGELHFFFL